MKPLASASPIGQGSLILVNGRYPYGSIVEVSGNNVDGRVFTVWQ